MFKNPEIQKYYEKLGEMTDSELKEEWNNVTSHIKHIYNIYNNIYGKNKKKNNYYNNINRTSSSVKFS